MAFLQNEGILLSHHPVLPMWGCFSRDPVCAGVDAFMMFLQPFLTKHHFCNFVFKWPFQINDRF